MTQMYIYKFCTIFFKDTLCSAYNEHLRHAALLVRAKLIRINQYVFIFIYTLFSRFLDNEGNSAENSLLAGNFFDYYL